MIRNYHQKCFLRTIFQQIQASKFPLPFESRRNICLKNQRLFVVDRSNNDDNGADSSSSTTKKTSPNSKLLLEQRFEKFRDEDSQIIFDDLDDWFNQKQKSIRKIRKPKTFELSRGRDGVFDLNEMIELLREENLQDIVVIKVPKVLKYCDYMIICTAMSKRHLKVSLFFLVRLKFFEFCFLHSFIDFR